MPSVDALAHAALSGDALLLGGIAQDWLREPHQFRTVPAPKSKDLALLAVAAALVEMFAERASQTSPDWTRDVPAAPEPLFLLREAATMKRLHTLCEQQSPLPLRRRRTYAPPGFLTFA